MYLLALAGLDHRSSLAYHRSFIADGQLWRFFTAHFAHLDMTHATLNAFSLPFVAYFFWLNNISLKRWLAAVSFSILGISAGLWYFSPEVIWYVGLSGLIHALIVIGLLCHANKISLLGFAILLFFLSKVLLEQSGFWIFKPVQLDHPVVYDAHFYGVVSSLFFYLLYKFYLMKKS